MFDDMTRHITLWDMAGIGATLFGLYMLPPDQQKWGGGKRIRTGVQSFSYQVGRYAQVVPC